MRPGYCSTSSRGAQLCCMLFHLEATTRMSNHNQTEKSLKENLLSPPESYFICSVRGINQHPRHPCPSCSERAVPIGPDLACVLTSPAPRTRQTRNGFIRLRGGPRGPFPDLTWGQRESLHAGRVSILEGHGWFPGESDGCC